MASELVRNVWCDVHGLEDRRTVPAAGEDVRFVVGSLSVVMDLCEECISEHVKPLAEFLDAHGRQADQATPAKPAAVKPAGTPRLTCSDCGKVYTYRSSLESHARDTHGKVLPRERASYAVDCPHCGREFGGAAGLSSHVKHSHPDQWGGPAK